MPSIMRSSAPQARASRAGDAASRTAPPPAVGGAEQVVGNCRDGVRVRPPRTADPAKRAAAALVKRGQETIAGMALEAPGRRLDAPRRRAEVRGRELLARLEPLQPQRGAQLGGQQRQPGPAH